MGKNKIICKCRSVSYLDIRHAMKSGARTIEAIMEETGATTCCGGCTNEVLGILESVCGCNSVLLKEVVEAVKNGANTVATVAEKTNAGTVCGRCSGLIENIIELKR